MTVAESINNAVAEGDILGLHIMMKDSLLVDPTFTEFGEMERLANNVKELYDPHDGLEFNTNKSTWNDDYMNKLMVQVVRNFSHERINHLKQVVQFLHPITSRPQMSAPRQTSVPRQQSQPHQQPAPPNGMGNQNRTSGNQPQGQSTQYQRQKQQDLKDGRTSNDRFIKIGVGVVAGGVIGAIGGVIVAATGHPIVAGVVIGAVTVGATTAILTSGGSHHG